MKNQRSRFGLVVEGNTTSSSILRLQVLARQLGPVKSTAFNAARRLANVLEGGVAVHSFEELNEASVILLCVPDRVAPRIIQNMSTADLDWHELSFVLCESWLDLEVLAPLAKRGAHTATCMNLPVGRPDWFVLDGALRAIRPVRRLIEDSGGRVNEMPPEGKHFLFASSLLTSTLAIPLYNAAQQALRISGFTGNVMNSVLEMMVLKAMRDFSRGARAHWSGPLADSSREASAAHLQAVASLRPELSSFLEAQMRLSTPLEATAVLATD